MMALSHPHAPMPTSNIRHATTCPGHLTRLREMPGGSVRAACVSGTMVQSYG